MKCLTQFTVVHYYLMLKPNLQVITHTSTGPGRFDHEETKMQYVRWPIGNVGIG